jgi:hypothetical protein
MVVYVTDRRMLACLPVSRMTLAVAYHCLDCRDWSWKHMGCWFAVAKAIQ